MSERCSPALTRQEPSSPTVLISTAPGLLSLGAPEPWDITHPAALLAGPCHQPCTGISLCRVQHCRVLGSPLPPSHPSCLPLLLAGVFPAVTTSPLASSWIPLCAPGASFPGPWWSPSFPLALGRGILHPGALKGAELPPRCLQPNRALSIPTSSLETRCAIPGKCSCSIYLPGCRGFQASSSEPFPSIHMLEAQLNKLCGE